MPEATEAQRRARLGSYGFSADKADTKCANLSGGEKARLLLALAAFHGPHLLILDEPTNHLDVDSREALVHALTEYEGAVILISHDRHLIEACADRLWVVRDGSVKPYDGDIDSLSRRAASRARRRHARAESGRREGRCARAARAPTSAVPLRIGALSLAPLKKAMQAAERDVEKLTAEIARLDTLLADPELVCPRRCRGAAQCRRARSAREAARAGRGSMARSERSIRARGRRGCERDGRVNPRAGLCFRVRKRNSRAYAHHK